MMDDAFNVTVAFFVIVFLIWVICSISMLIQVIYRQSKGYFLLLRNYKGDKMPLVKGEKAKTKKGFSENVRREREAGKPIKQSVAIAYSEARASKKPKKSKKG
jgi:hypothetical protein